MNTETEKRLQDRIAGLEAENVELRAFKESVANQTKMLNCGFWDHPKEGDPAGELFRAITLLNDDVHAVGKQRDQYQEDLARLTGTLTDY